ncbi:cold-shock protein [Piscirickettsia litoralis]|uniref:Cold-shock protein n=1 Tax=Piscirickettsia litoralis TaxID=1891921 RepID=A0ABX3A373_9GAMM|nr:cold shock domain-containing protein [Piscirickettsia litoralis]ODN42960.1 cold-shock protein [Piscirickettsia litoralis]
MADGFVKWFNNETGFGYITPQDGGDDIFVHRSGFDPQANIESLDIHQKVSYSIHKDTSGTPYAADVVLIEKNNDTS